MSFNLLCWNIQKLNESKAADFSFNIGAAIKAAGIGDNYIGFILENKLAPDVVISLLQRYMADFTFNYVSAGGGQYTQENIIYFSKGVSISPAELVELNMDMLSSLNAQRNSAELQQHAQRPQNLRARTGTAGFSPADQYNKPRECYRKPLLVQINDGVRDYRVATLHAPGPDYMTREIWEYVYSPALKSVNADIVIGDFNLRAEIPRESGWLDISAAKLTRRTTFNKSSTDFGVSKWDKVILRESAGIHSGHFADVQAIVPEVRHISEYVGLALMVGSQSGGPSIQLAGRVLAIFAGLASRVSPGLK